MDKYTPQDASSSTRENTDETKKGMEDMPAPAVDEKKELEDCLAEMKKNQGPMEEMKKRKEELRDRIIELSEKAYEEEIEEYEPEDFEEEKMEEMEEEETKEEEVKKRTMEEIGYHFKEGKLRKIEDDGPFTFTTQKEYEELGDRIGEKVYEMMEEIGLERRYVETGKTRRFYFASPGFQEKERILVLIHGSGVVKAGQWARRLIINESLDRGTQLPYIKRGLANNWGIVVINYNEKCEGAKDRCHFSDEHGLAEWADAITDNVDAEIMVVAHSAGGDVASGAVRRMQLKGDFRVKVVTLTDSWFTESNSVFAVNFNTQKEQLNRNYSGTWQMYSGDDTHEGTSAACINALFAVLEAVDDMTTTKEFLEILECSEEIIFKEWKEKQEQKKKQEKKNGDETMKGNGEEEDEGTESDGTNENEN